MSCSGLISHRADGGLDDFDIRHDTGGNQIPDKDWRDNVYISENIQEKTVDSLIGTQGRNETSGSDIKCYAEDMKKMDLITQNLLM